MSFPPLSKAGSHDAMNDGAARERAVARDRVDWVDVAKGIGIIIVVFGHTLGGLIDGGLTPVYDWFRPLFLSIYLFHMPLFFFLSGLFIVKRISGNKLDFLSKLAVNIVWPYFLWGVLQNLVIYSASRYVNSPIEDIGTAMAWIFVSPPSQFWFLYVLFVAQILSLLLIPLLRPSGFLILSILMLAFSPAGLPVVPSMTVQMLPFFALGAWVGHSPRAMAATAAMSRLSIAGLCLLAGLAIWLCATHTVAGVGAQTFATLRPLVIAAEAWRWTNILAALFGSAAVVALSVGVPLRFRTFFSYLGSWSMAIYVLHIMVIAGSRIVLVKLFGFTDPVALLFILAIMGLAVPLIVAEIARRMGLRRLLAL